MVIVGRGFDFKIAGTPAAAGHLPPDLQYSTILVHDVASEFNFAAQKPFHVASRFHDFHTLRHTDHSEMDPLETPSSKENSPVMSLVFGHKVG